MSNEKVLEITVLEQVIPELTKDEQILEFIDSSDFSRVDVLITLQMVSTPPTKRGKLEIGQYSEIMGALNKGVTNKDLSIKYGVTPSRISEIKTGKSIPQGALRSWMAQKYSTV